MKYGWRDIIAIAIIGVGFGLSFVAFLIIGTVLVMAGA